MYILIKFIYSFVAWILLFNELDSGNTSFFIAAFMFIGSMALDMWSYLKENRLTKSFVFVDKIAIGMAILLVAGMAIGVAGGLQILNGSPITIVIADGNFIDNIPQFRALEPLLNNICFMIAVLAIIDIVLGIIVNLVKDTEEKQKKVKNK